MAGRRATALAAPTAMMLTVMLLAGCSGEKRAVEPTPSGSAPQSSSTPTASTPAPSTTPTPSTTPGSTTTPPTSTPTTSTPARRVFRYQPAWPFTSEAGAAAWQRSYRSGGHQPWHLDPAETTLSFSQQFLGFTDLKLITSRSVTGDEAFVGVGYQIDTGRKFTAAIVHLARLGQGKDAPWEVVGTRDTDLTLTAPRYGATAGSPLSAGGRITGVDEAIRLDVRQASTATALGTSCCIPAGGERTPWSGKVTYRGATDPVLVLIASAGGHNQRTERFAITAVRRP